MSKQPRPRDVAGRPLPYGQQGVPPVPEEPDRPPAEVLTLANAYLAAGRPFAAHEVLETAWKSRPDAERDLWQGLAQIAVGLTHLQRGNQTGAIALLRRGGERLAGATDAPAVGDLRAIGAEADALADLLEARDPAAATRAAELRLRSPSGG